MKKLSKVSQVRKLLAQEPQLTPTQIAERVGCYATFVYQVRKEVTMKKDIGAIVKVKIAKKASVKSKGGRPTNATLEAQAVMEAGSLFADLVKGLRDMCITFDTNRSKVEIMWGEELFDTSVADLPKAIETIKYLQSIQKDFKSIVA